VLGGSLFSSHYYKMWVQFSSFNSFSLLQNVGAVQEFQFVWKFLNSHLFWLNSHPGCACLVLRACRSVAFLDHDFACEFNQKRCELKKFHSFSLL